MRRPAGGENSGSSISRPLAVASNEVHESPKYFCIRSVEQQTGIYNDSKLECTVTFVVDKNICVLGLQVPSQILNVVIINLTDMYMELRFYATDIIFRIAG